MASRAARSTKLLKTWLVFLAVGTVGDIQAKQSRVPVHSYEVVAEYPHDENAFCQGLIFNGKKLFESTGQYGHSSIRRVDLETGEIEKQLRLNRKIFTEGLTLLEGKLYQLTWKQQIGFIYDANTLQPLSRFSYQGEGWGLTNDGKDLIMSDGSDKLRYLNANSFRPFKTIRVHEGNQKIKRLNELEFVKGKIYANIWFSDRIAIIEPSSGEVTAWIDLKGICKEPLHREAVLNGIAYEQATDRLFVTGKYWPKLYEIKVVENE